MLLELLSFLRTRTRLGTIGNLGSRSTLHTEAKGRTMVFSNGRW